MREFRMIDTKVKEIYFKAEVIKNEEDSARTFWNALNVMAINNIGIQNLQSHA